MDVNMIVEYFKSLFKKTSGELAIFIALLLALNNFSLIDESLMILFISISMLTSFILIISYLVIDNIGKLAVKITEYLYKIRNYEYEKPESEISLTNNVKKAISKETDDTLPVVRE